ncbi:MAG: GntR family transcriptional regulator [Prevotellaceae bacterium]|nr:GntR family transcriptional regulator [Candidatus Colivivens equi]MCQ2076977.1 GntR family transcriptional regulator [Bacteroidaceae bacterium]
MTFNEHKSIYLQVADYICEKILAGEFKEEGRIPSVRETAAEVEVNSNTVMRSYDYLQGLDIIFTQRGLGYFVNKGAQQAVKQMRKDEFINNTLPGIAHAMQSLDMSTDEVINILNTLL